MSIILWNWEGLLQGDFLQKIAADLAFYGIGKRYEWKKQDSCYILKFSERSYLFDLDPFISTCVPRLNFEDVSRAKEWPGPFQGTIESVHIQENSSLVLLTKNQGELEGWIIRLCARVPNIVWIHEGIHPLRESHFNFSLSNLQKVSPASLSQEFLLQNEVTWHKRKEFIERARKEEAIGKHFDKELHLIETRLEKLKNSLERAPHPENLKHEAMLFQAYGHSFNDSTLSLEVYDWIQGKEVEIKRPEGTLQNHISGLFRKAKGFEKHLVVLQQQIKTLEERKVELLQKHEHCLKTLTLPIEKEVLKGKNVPLLLKGIRSFEYLGALFLVGKSSKDNMKLSFNIASGNDLWLHIQDHPGSHVVVKKRDPEINLTNPAILEVGALLAHHFSSARQYVEVDVTWTFAKWIKRLPGAKTGTVGVQEAHRCHSRQNPLLLAKVFSLSQEL